MDFECVTRQLIFLGGGFKYFFNVHSYLGKMNPFWLKNSNGEDFINIFMTCLDKLVPHGSWRGLGRFWCRKNSIKFAHFRVLTYDWLNCVGCIPWLKLTENAQGNEYCNLLAINFQGRAVSFREGIIWTYKLYMFNVPCIFRIDELCCFEETGT